MNIRRALGFIREGDPGAWQCFAGHWNVGPECGGHRMRVFGPPTTRPPAVLAPPPRPVINVRIVP